MAETELNLKDLRTKDVNYLLEERESSNSLRNIFIEQFGQTALYDPNHSQLPVHKSASRERWVFGGNGLGKDTLIANETTWHALGCYPPYYPDSCKMSQPSAGRVCSINFNDGILGIVLPELEKWAPKGSFKFKKDQRIVEWRNGSTTQMKSFDQDIQSFAGQNLSYVHVSEHQMLAQYRENLIRLRLPGVQRFLGVLTPVDGAMSWEFDEIYEVYETGRREKPELEVFRGRTSDNLTNLPDNYLDNFKNLPPDLQRVRLFGDFVALSGLVYPEYRDWRYQDIRPGDMHGGHLVEQFEIPSHWARYMAIDPHKRKSFAMLWVAVSPHGDHVYYDELYIPPDSGLLVEDYAKLIKKKEGNTHGVIRARIIDSSAKEHDPITGVDIQAALSKCGIKTRATRKKDKDHAMGFQAVRSGLEYKLQEGFDTVFRPRVLIMEHLKRLRYEFRHYVYEEYVRHRENYDLKESPRKKDDDLMDCLRYLEMTHLPYESTYPQYKLAGNGRYVPC